MNGFILGIQQVLKELQLEVSSFQVPKTAKNVRGVLPG